MSKLNAKLIQHAASKNVEYRLSDGNGLFLRVRPSGAKSWIYCFRLPGSRKLQQMTMGSLNDISLKEARTVLAGLRKQVSEGIDPRHARAAIKVQNAEAITMQELFDKWIAHIKFAAQLSAQWIKRHEDRWRLHLKKPLGVILAKDIHRAHLAQALDIMVRKGTREETRKALSTLNMMLDYGLARHYIDENPARILKPKDFSATAGRPRDRVLSLQELHLLWQALNEGTIIRNGLATHNTMSIISSTAIKLLILTGARRGEVAAMRWDEIDLDVGTWTLAWERTKNRRAHTVYLSALAISLLKNIMQISGESQFVFDTGRQSQNSHIHEDSLTSAVAKLRGTKGTKKIAPLSDLKPFTVHDLRRSAATAWGEHLKTAPHVIEKMLNHQPLNKLIATYQHAVYAQEQKETWLKWGAFIEQHVSCASHTNPPMSI